MSIYDKFDKQYDLDGLKEDIENAKENGGDSYREVPPGDYEVAVDKMELGESKSELPMVIIWFKIIEGEYKNSRLFYNQVVNKGFQINNCNDLLRSLAPKYEGTIAFDSFSQYGQMLLDLHEYIDGNYEFSIKYSRNKKDYPVYKVNKIYELE